MSDKGLEKAKKRIKENREKLGMDPAPETEPEEVVVAPEEPVKEPETESTPEPSAEPVAEPEAESEPTPEPEANPAPEAEPTPEPEAEPNPLQAEVDRLKALADEQRKKLNDEDGQRGSALQSLRHENALLFEQLQQARAARDSAPPVSTEDDDPVSEEKLQAWISHVPEKLRNKYDDDYWRDAARVSIIADQVRGDSGDSDLREKIDTIGKTQQELAADRWLSEADRIAAEAGAEGFTAANQNDEGWAQRLQQPVFPGSGMTTREFLELPDTQPRAAAEMYVQYKGVTAEPAAPSTVTPQTGPPRPTLREQVTSRPSATPGRKETPRTMTQAEYHRRRNDAAYANGDKAKQAAWNEAKRFMAEGRVSG